MNRRSVSAAVTRNALMAAVGALAVGLLVAAAVETYLLFSYLAALFILAVMAGSVLEYGSSEFDFSPYNGLLLGLGGLFLVGLTGIWVLWNPSVTEYTYVLGLPTPTLVYVVFIWLLPLAGAVYYSLVFPQVGSEAVVDDIIERARDAQRTEEFPLDPTRTRTDGGDEE